MSPMTMEMTSACPKRALVVTGSRLLVRNEREMRVVNCVLQLVMYELVSLWADANSC
jgi:hypothetical protein